MVDWDNPADTSRMNSDNSARKVSIGALVGQVSDQFGRLLRAEVDSYKKELKEKATKSGLGIGLIVAGAVIAIYAVGVLIYSAVAGLANAVPLWLSALIIGIVLLGIVGILVMVGVKALKNNVPPGPNVAVARIKEDLNNVKEDIK